MVACMRGFIRIGKLLLERGAEHNTQCQLNGWSALMFAANGGTKRSLIPSSIVQNEDPSVLDPQEPPASKLEIVQLLLSYGTDATLKNWLGMTAADVAESSGQKDVHELLQRVIFENADRRNRSRAPTASTIGGGSSPARSSPTNTAAINLSSSSGTNALRHSGYSEGGDLDERSGKVDTDMCLTYSLKGPIWKNAKGQKAEWRRPQYI